MLNLCSLPPSRKKLKNNTIIQPTTQWQFEKSWHLCDACFQRSLWTRVDESWWRQYDGHFGMTGTVYQSILIDDNALPDNGESNNDDWWLWKKWWPYIAFAWGRTHVIQALTHTTTSPSTAGSVVFANDATETTQIRVDETADSVDYYQIWSDNCQNMIRIIRFKCYSIYRKPRGSHTN